MSASSHREAWNAWRSALAGERMHHAWLLAGKPGLGKAQFARAAARELVAGQGVPQPQGDHPDIVILSHPPKDDKEQRKRAEGKPFELKRNIPVDAVRAMQQRLITRPTLGDRRAVIVEPADDLEKSASNALLKSLEEPPQGTIFLLVSHRPASLLPTIRSRCRILRFPDLDHDEIERLVTSEYPQVPAELRNRAIAAANGSVGSALAFLDHDLAPVEALTSRILATGDPGFVLRAQLSAALGARPDRARVQASLDLAQNVLSIGTAGADRPRQAAMITCHAELVRLAGQAPTYNFDPGLLAMEMGTLLARVAEASERADA